MGFTRPAKGSSIRCPLCGAGAGVPCHHPIPTDYSSGGGFFQGASIWRGRERRPHAARVDLERRVVAKSSTTTDYVVLEEGRTMGIIDEIERTRRACEAARAEERDLLRSLLKRCLEAVDPELFGKRIYDPVLVRDLRAKLGHPQVPDPDISGPEIRE